MENEPVAALIAACIAGDPAAKAQFYDTYKVLVQRAVRRKLHRHYAYQGVAEDADDICHEIFERAFSDNCQLMTRIRRPASINAWLMTVAGNHVVTHMRKHNLRRDASVAAMRERPPEPAASPEESAIDEETRLALQAKVAELPKLDRVIVELYFIQDLKYAEIAEALSLNINTVSARLRRAKAKLRKLLE